VICTIGVAKRNDHGSRVGGSQRELAMAPHWLGRDGAVLRQQHKEQRL